MNRNQREKQRFDHVSFFLLTTINYALDNLSENKIIIVGKLLEIAFVHCHKKTKKKKKTTNTIISTKVFEMAYPGVKL